MAGPMQVDLLRWHWSLAGLAGAPALMLLWVLGALITLAGALCYAELATMYPENGGDYVYLTHAYGRPVGFLFAWAQLWIIRPGSIGALAYVFAQYAHQLLPIGKGWQAVMGYAIAAILALTGINLLGVRQGKWTQNLLTSIKVLGLTAVFLVGISSGSSAGTQAHTPVTTPANFKLALILVLFAYAGWYEMACVGAEVRDPKRNILRALVLGTLVVTAVYLLVNLSFIFALGYDRFAASQAVAVDVMKLRMGDWAGRLISLLICASALGAINGLTFTGARINYAVGREHRIFSWLGRWSAERDTPVWSLLLQAAVTLTLVIGFGWARGQNGFVTLVRFTTPVFWLFFFLVGVGLVVLRFRQPEVARPYRVPLFPLPPVLFCGTAVFMMYSSITYALDNKSNEAWWSIGIFAVGVVVCAYDVIAGRRPSRA
jgi:amino acid transporter